MEELSEKYDNWNSKKKEIASQKSDIVFSEGDIWWCSVGINIGTEVFGKGENFRRPVLVLRKLSHETCIGIPLTSKEKIGTWFQEITFNNQRNWAMLYQVRMIHSNRFQRRLAVVDHASLVSVKEKLQQLLEPSDNHPSDHFDRTESVGNPKNIPSLSEEENESRKDL